MNNNLGRINEFQDEEYIIDVNFHNYGIFNLLG